MELRIQEDSEFEELIKNFQRVWESESERTGNWNVEATWRRLERRMSQNPNKDQIENKKKVRKNLNNPRWNKHQLLRIAAIFTIVALLSLFTVLWLEKPEAGQEKQISMSEVSTERGQRAEVRLKDGSRIHLNSDSKLSYPREFNSDSRIVQLTGEAYFDIAGEERPFFVYAEGAVIQIHGTEFNVESYADENEVQVIVSEGSVSVALTNVDTNEPALLEKGDMALLKQQEQVISVIHDIDLDLHLEWLDNRITFDDTPMKDVVKRLERWYGVDILLSDPKLESQHFSATFDDESIHEVLRILELSLNIDSQIEDQTIVLSMKE